MSLKRTRDEEAVESGCAVGSHILSCMRQAKHAFSNNIKMPWERQFVGPWDRASQVLTLAKPLKDLQTAVSRGDEALPSDVFARESAFKKAGMVNVPVRSVLLGSCLN